MEIISAYLPMINRFKISNHNAIILAECSNVPSLMIIYWQPAVGKSTLLHAFNHGEIYEVATNYDHNSHSIDSTYLSLFLQEDHGKILQRSLHKFEISRRNILAKYYNENNGYTPESIIPNVYDPLKQWLHLLMPHLSFERPDIDDDDNSPEDVKCPFSKKFEDDCVDNDHDDDNIHNYYHGEIDRTQITTREKEILAFLSNIGKTGAKNHNIEIQRG